LKKGDLESGLSNYRRNSLLPGQPKMEVAPMFDINDPVVIEWRALTITYIEIVASKVRDRLKSKKPLSLPQVLEGGIWNVSSNFLCSMLAITRGRPFQRLIPVFAIYSPHSSIAIITRNQAGRELAEISRPNTQEPPIVIKVRQFHQWSTGHDQHSLIVLHRIIRLRRTPCFRNAQGF
jgi:hypothetical protein